MTLNAVKPVEPVREIFFSVQDHDPGRLSVSSHQQSHKRYLCPEVIFKRVADKVDDSFQAFGINISYGLIVTKDECAKEGTFQSIFLFGVILLIPLLVLGSLNGSKLLQIYITNKGRYQITEGKLLTNDRRKYNNQASYQFSYNGNYLQEVMAVSHGGGVNWPSGQYLF